MLGFRSVIFTCFGFSSICPLFDRSSSSELDQTIEIDISKNIEKKDQFLQWAIRCRDSVVEPVERSWKRYLEYSGHAEKFDTLPSFVYTIDPGHYSDCEQALSSTGAQNVVEPRLVLLLKNTIQHAKYFAQLTRKVATEGTDSNSNNVETEFQLPDHQSIRTAYSQWQQSDFELDQLIDEVKRTNDTALLQLWSKTKSDLEYRTKAVMIQARLFARCVHANSNELSACTPLQQEFYSTWSKFSNLLSENHEQAERVFWMQTFAEDLESYVQCSHDILLSKNAKRETVEHSRCQRDYATLLRDESTLDFNFP